MEPIAYHLASTPMVADLHTSIIGSKSLPGYNLATSYGVAPCPRQNCQGPVLIWFETTNLAFRQSMYDIQTKLIYAGPPPKILGTWPEASSPDDSENWPEKIRAIFFEIQEDVQNKRDPARIVGACRSVLEVALANLGYDNKKGKNLSDRIDMARQDGILTENMKNWAHKTRMDGNEAIHELKSTFEESQELVNFIRTFLDLSFDLPERINKLSFGQKPS